MAIGIGIVLLVSLGVFSTVARRGGGDGERSGRAVVQTIHSGDIDIVLLADGGVLRHGRNRLTLEFKQRGTAKLLDVGVVTGVATMSMPGMAMPASVTVEPADPPGRYEAIATFGMAGAWQVSIQWKGPAGEGSAKFEGNVQ